MEYSSPKLDTQEMIEWHKEGYDSNEIATQIKSLAFENGHKSSSYYIPKEFEVNDASIALYDKLFNQGQELRRVENQKKIKAALGIGIPVSGFAIVGFIKRKRKRK